MHASLAHGVEVYRSLYVDLERLGERPKRKANGLTGDVSIPAPCARPTLYGRRRSTHDYTVEICRHVVQSDWSHLYIEIRSAAYLAPMPLHCSRLRFGDLPSWRLNFVWLVSGLKLLA